MANAAVPIETLVFNDIEDAVRRALLDRLRPELLEDFLANVDWSKQDRAGQPIRETLGLLEQCATEYAESNLSEAEYREQLLGILPADERLQPAARK